jgi:hypothetical protein
MRCIFLSNLQIIRILKYEMKMEVKQPSIIATQRAKKRKNSLNRLYEFLAHQVKPDNL